MNSKFLDEIVDEITKQKPLSPEFKKVVTDNLWDLVGLNQVEPGVYCHDYGDE